MDYSVNVRMLRSLGWLGVFHLPVSLAEVIEPFKRIPLKVWACNFCSLSKDQDRSNHTLEYKMIEYLINFKYVLPPAAHDPANDECGLPIICIFLAFLFCIVLKVVHSTIK